VDGDVPSHPSVDHLEIFTWKPAPSRLRPQVEGSSCDQPSLFDLSILFANQQQDSSGIDRATTEEELILLPQATAPSDDSREVLLAPEIEIDFGDEPMIELASCY